MGNKYRLGRKIGSGSFGDIYLGKLELLVFNNDSFGLSHCCVSGNSPSELLHAPPQVPTSPQVRKLPLSWNA